jgi:xanthine dehydrogenase accessory factor
MREVLADVLRWWDDGQRCAVATVVDTFGSAPRLPGASMAVGPDGRVVGSVSGGCVEGAVYELCRTAIATDAASVHRFGVSDDEALGVGLTCGGTIEILVQPVDHVSFPELSDLVDLVVSGHPVVVSTVVEHPDPAYLGTRVVLTPDGVMGTLVDEGLHDAVTADARAAMDVGTTRTREYGVDGVRLDHGVRVLTIPLIPGPRLLVFGAIDFAAAVAEVGAFLGYRVTVCDARPVFATRARFPAAAEVVVDWPHRYLAAEADSGRIDARAAVCVLTHDPKFDVPLLEVALRLPAGVYVGAMGSRRTHRDRTDRLRQVGLTDTELDRLSSPIGLDLGARTPEETAVSIAAELVARRRTGSGKALSRTSGPIHGTRSPSARAREKS